MLAIKLKKKRPSTHDIRTTAQVESQWKQLIDHLGESKNATSLAASLAASSSTTEKPVGQEAIASHPANVGRHDLDSSLRILTTHCCTAIVIGLASLVTGVLSSAIAGAYLTGTFATCGFVGLEMFRLRTQPQALPRR